MKCTRRIIQHAPFSPKVHDTSTSGQLPPQAIQHDGKTANFFRYRFASYLASSSPLELLSVRGESRRAPVHSASTEPSAAACARRQFEIPASSTTTATCAASSGTTAAFDLRESPHDGPQQHPERDDVANPGQPSTTTAGRRAAGRRATSPRAPTTDIRLRPATTGCGRRLRGPPQRARVPVLWSLAGRVECKLWPSES